MPACRCAECGFLAVRERQTRELEEVTADLRGKWELPKLLNTSFYKYDDFPVCLHSKAKLSIDGPYQKDQVIGLLHLERQCDTFTPWQPGFTPKEHQEMLNAQAILTAQQQQREQERAWQAEQAAAARAWQVEQDRARREQAAAQDAAKREREDARDRESREWQASQNQTNRTLQAAIAGVAIVFSLIGVVLGKHLSSPTQPIVIQVPVPVEKTPDAK